MCAAGHSTSCTTPPGRGTRGTRSLRSAASAGVAYPPRERGVRSRGSTPGTRVAGSRRRRSSRMEGSSARWAARAGWHPLRGRTQQLGALVGRRRLWGMSVQWEMSSDWTQSSSCAFCWSWRSRPRRGRNASCRVWTSRHCQGRAPGRRAVRAGGWVRPQCRRLLLGTAVCRPYLSQPWAGCGSVSCRGTRGKCRAMRAPAAMMVTAGDPFRRPRSCSTR